MFSEWHSYPVPKSIRELEKNHNSYTSFQTVDQELNVTRRTNKPFIPTNAPNYWAVQRQVQDMEEPIPQPKPTR